MIIWIFTYKFPLNGNYHDLYGFHMGSLRISISRWHSLEKWSTEWMVIFKKKKIHLDLFQATYKSIMLLQSMRSISKHFYVITLPHPREVEKSLVGKTLFSHTLIYL